MKKKVRKSIIILLGVALMLPCTVNAMDKQVVTAAGVKRLKSKIETMKTEQEKFLASDEVQDNCRAAELHHQLMDVVETNEEINTHFSGSYINDENKLVVRLKGAGENEASNIRKALGTEDVLVETSDITLSELKSLEQDYLTKAKELMQKSQLNNQETMLAQDLVGFGIRESTSKILVRIYELNDEKISAFRLVFGNENNTIFENVDRPELTASWYTGSLIYPANQSRQTTGYRAYHINGAGIRKNGFVTAGHKCSVGNTVYGPVSGGTVILGTCLYSMCTGSVDAAFVAFTTSDYMPSNTVSSDLASGQTILATTTATNSDLAEGTRIYTFGAVSGMKTGRILLNSHNIIFDDLEYDYRAIYVDIAVVTPGSKRGDSGGCVTIIKGGGYATAGTILGSNDTEGYFSKYINQNSILGVVKY